MLSALARPPNLIKAGIFWLIIPQLEDGEGVGLGGDVRFSPARVW